jgi:hypothetical protein
MAMVSRALSAEITQPLCGVSDRCDDRALTAFFQRSLDAFTQDYYELLRQLGALP